MIWMGIALFPAATSGEELKVKPIEEATVIDAAHRRVGSIAAPQGPVAAVLVEVEGHIFSLNVTNDRLSATGPSLAFANPFGQNTHPPWAALHRYYIDSSCKTTAGHGCWRM